MMVIACVDYFIKMVQLMLLQESNTQTMANMFLSTVVSYCGLLDFITSDHDPRFFGHFWNELMSLFDTTFKFSTASQPQIDRIAEVMDHTMEQLLLNILNRMTEYGSYP